MENAMFAMNLAAKLLELSQTSDVSATSHDEMLEPRQEMVAKFDRYQFVLMPKTQEHVQSIHVDLAANKLSDREAQTVINRFLSIMTWCDHQFAIALVRQSRSRRSTASEPRLHDHE
jgi:hypothetical protein